MGNEETILDNFTVMHKDEAVVRVEYKNDVPIIIKFTDNPMKQPFLGDYSLERQVYDLCKSRCYEDCRADLKNILHEAGMDTNDPFEWCRKTHGVTYEDLFWMKFDGEEISWDDVKVR